MTKSIMRKMKDLLTPSFTFILIFFYIILLYVFYKSRKIYDFLFNSILGYISILTFIGIMYYINNGLGILMGFSLGLLYLLSRSINFLLEKSSPKREGFTWSQESLDKFNDFQNTYNRNAIYDMSFVQQQASEEEAKELFEKGQWPWSDETQKLFMENVQNNTVIKNVPEDSMKIARTMYNENIMKQMLSWKAPEGQMLLSGVFVGSSPTEKESQQSGSGTYAMLSGLISPDRNLIKCGKSSSGSGEMVMQMTKSLGNDGIFGVHKEQVIDISNEELPNLIPGFQFLTDKPCNPCVAINNPPQYTCPFSISDGESGVSSIWKNLWGLKESEPTKVSEEKNIDKNKFPILSQLKTELGKINV